MDQSDRESSQRAQTPAHRDMMYCHECHDEWYRDEHGLTCPECGSDFTEIIEEDHDPRNDEIGNREDDDGSMPPLEERPPHLHPLFHHHPWRDNDDPEEGDLSNFQWRQTSPGTFAVTGTIYRTVSPSRGGGGGNQNVQNPLMNSFATMLNSIVGGGRPGAQRQGQSDEAADGQATPGANSGPGIGTAPGGHRFTYHSSARLYPRDPDHPGPRLEPVDELNNVIMGLMAALGEPPGHQHNHGPSDHPHTHPLNPLATLFSHLIPGNGAHGDFVYSQEALDRIISQLMEQNATGNAPGPASQDDIDSLPKKQITTDMLGPEGRAECSICMDEVNIGEEVSELPCHHWFHHPCVAAWLSEHDTCPHCRQGISKSNENENSANATSGSSSGAAGGANTNASNQMPGAFGITGEGTLDHPFIVSDTPEQRRGRSSSDRQGRPSSADEGNSGGSLSERLRRGLFGAPR
ncbi:hypothetical protein K469DRAFT_552121 [Zopfia rhizophila CBS 207.26]|uniref:RING-type E3 ubiquitin transferase n=1 Tax=Zopfia rhizophila CBS 207.26 TaxID=1314779 RepID=A0A6A6EPI5_9PEZI|nr:hypothetical protein K469DRAFT_552121 [Zopfia rhizophila CBS 207.26]